MNGKKKIDGWLLDVSTCSEGVLLWVKEHKEHRIVKIISKYSPEFFAVPKAETGSDFKRLKQILKSHPSVKSVRLCEKYVTLEDHEKKKIFGVSVAKPFVFKAAIREIDKLGLFTLYNTIFQSRRCIFT